MPKRDNAEIQSRLIMLIASASTIDEAAAAVGLPVATARRWLTLGRKGNPEYAEFARAVDQHRARPLVPISRTPGEMESSIRASAEMLGDLDPSQRMIATAMTMAARAADRASDRGSSADATLAIRVRDELVSLRGRLAGETGLQKLIDELWKITFEICEEDGIPAPARPLRASAAIAGPLPESCVDAVDALLSGVDPEPDTGMAIAALKGAAEAMDQAAGATSARGAKPALDALRSIMRHADELHSPASWDDVREALIAGSDSDSEYLRGYQSLIAQGGRTHPGATPFTAEKLRSLEQHAQDQGGYQ